MDLLETLKAQHGHLEDLFHEISLAKDVPTRAAILEELASELIAHRALEERILRRALFSAPREPELWQDWESRLCADRVTNALEAIDLGDATFSAKVASLEELFEDRIEYEETWLFPKLRRFVDQPTAAMPPARAGTHSPEPSLAMGGES